MHMEYFHCSVDLNFALNISGIFLIADYRSSDETPLDSETRLNEIDGENDIADEIQAKLASIKGTSIETLFTSD